MTAVGSTVSAEQVRARLRAMVPAVRAGAQRGWRFFDGPSGTQMLDGCIDALSDYVRGGMANRRQSGPTGEHTDDVLARARSEVARFVRADGYHVIFGQNMTSLAFAIGRALMPTIGAERTVAFTELEHFGNVDPWRQDLARYGHRESWLDVDAESLCLDTGALERALARGPLGLLAITLASNAVGSTPDVAAAIGAAHAAGALVVVDGVQAVPHRPVDVAALDADVFLFSAYKVYGPHLGIALIKDELAERLHPQRVSAAPATGSDAYETGTQNHEAIAGLLGTIDGLARCVGGAGGDGARQAIEQLAVSQDAIVASLEESFRELPAVQVFRARGDGAAQAPILAFRVQNRTPADCAAALAAQGLFITHGDFYARALAKRVGVADDGGWTRIGVSGYNEPGEADELAAAIAAL